MVMQINMSDGHNISHKIPMSRFRFSQVMLWQVLKYLSECNLPENLGMRESFYCRLSARVEGNKSVDFNLTCSDFDLPVH